MRPRIDWFLLPLAGLCLAADSAPDRDDAFVASRRGHWAYKAPARPASRPEVLSAPAQPLTRKLIRRLSLDLTGLPPAPDEVESALTGSYEQYVDRLMASPHYAERWALKWLDVVRYADTNGFELDSERPQAWRYRDYVIRAFASRKPYDRFILEQIAGDELFPGNTEALIATGFLRAGARHVVGGNTDVEMNRQEELIEMTASVGGAFLGLTVNCARCHNHKFDAIPQADYYRLQASLTTAGFEDEISTATPEEKARYAEQDAAWKARMKPIQEQIAEIEKPYRERLKAERRAKLAPEFRAALEVPKESRTMEQGRLAAEAESQIKLSWDDVVGVLTPVDRERRAALRRQIHAIELEAPEHPPSVYGVRTTADAPLTFVLKVGDHKMKQDVVEPGVLRVIARPGDRVPLGPEGRRAVLARWIASPENPLTARVMVNRIWQLRLGTGIVATPNDFGVLGTRPSDPKLLDWLATEFVASGWDVRAIDRLVLLSAAYRDQTKPRRLEAEHIRDAALAASGALNPRQFGKPVKIPIEPEVYDLIFTEGEPDNLWPVDPDRREHYRRSLYLLNKRTVRLPFLANFDQPDAMSLCPVRPSSTHALQALSLMNSPMMRDIARQFAGRLDREGGDKVARAYALALARAPSEKEVAMAKKFLADGGALEDFCLAMFNRNEFVYVP